MNNSYISLIAMIVAVFFSGIYLRGESARKKEIKRELDLIREQQDQIIAHVDEINRVTAERDELLLSRIDSAKNYIDLLNVQEGLSSEKIEGFGVNIELLQQDIKSNLADIARSQGIREGSPALEVVPTGQ